MTAIQSIAAEKGNTALMAKENFYAKLERGEKAYKQGECHEVLPGEDLTAYLIRRGYDI